MSRLLVCLMLLSVAACAARHEAVASGPRRRDHSTPFRAVWGDYSGMCPTELRLLSRATALALLPELARLLRGRVGAVLLLAPPPPGDYYGQRREYEHEQYERGRRRSIRKTAACDARDMMCSQGGRTICCPQRSRCLRRRRRSVIAAAPTIAVGTSLAVFTIESMLH